MQNQHELLSRMKPRIAKITGTYGTEVQNGVGRFLAGLHEWSQTHEYPLRVFTSGDHTQNYERVQDIHALSFPIPTGYEAVQAYYPLEGRRKQLRRSVKAFQPDIIHLSTPEAIGATGLWIARRYKVPIAGIYHTDFPSFAHNIVRNAVGRFLDTHDVARLTEATADTIWQRLQPAYRTHTRWWERWLLGFVARRILKRNREALKLNIGRASDWFANAAQAAVREAMSRFYGQFQLVIARSNIYREKLIQELSIPADRVRTLRRGVDVQVFSPERTAIDLGLRDRLGIPEKAKIVLYVGRVTEEKNVGFLAEAWRAFQAQNQNEEQQAAFVVAGSGNLKEFRERAGPGVYTIGAQHGETLSAVYRLADVFWTASTTETLGQVILEAHASSVPTIVPDQGAARESVDDGRSGSVLPVDSPLRWSQELQALVSEKSRLPTMGRAARARALSHTIEDSYRHYWELHEELFDRLRSPATVARNSTRHSDSRSGERNSSVQGRASTHISDFHAGKRSKKIPKEAALHAACERVSQRNAKLFLHGDFLDTRPRAHKFREEIAAVRQTFRDHDIHPEMYIEGNHDYEFGRAEEIEDLLSCPVARSLVEYDRETGLVLTHGHVSELPGIQNLLQSVRGGKELIESLSIDRLEATLKQFALQYDMVGVVTSFLENGGLEGLEDAWRQSFSGRRWIADQLMEVARNRALDDHAVKALIHMIGSSDREHVLGQLCARLGGWGLVYGHTHEPHVTKQQVVDPLTGQSRMVLLGNSGSFRRKTVPPTWIEAAFPSMELWAYNSKDDCAECLDRVTLSDEEMRPYNILSPAIRDHLGSTI